ncbi:Hypothetical protein A7982_09623 [Minicystis rosea]|nr:Hypothetical protein A7982_09623 [Minicystis rosea]
MDSTRHINRRSPALRGGLGAFALLLLASCGSSSESTGGAGGTGGQAASGPLYALGSVVLNDDGTRTTYVQTIKSLDITSIDNKNAIEVPGNGTLTPFGDSILVGLAEEPTIVRYKPDAAGVLRETGRVSFLNYGLSHADFGSVVADPTHAYMISSEQFLAIQWNPTTMEVTTTTDLAYLKQDGFDTEFWTTTARDGKVYIPARYANWDDGVILKKVSLVILDAASGKVLGTAEDDRCYSGGRPSFTANGDAYVMADGRSYSAQMYANAAGQPPPPNCILKIPAGTTAFDPNYLREVPKITNGLETTGEMLSVVDGSGVAFTLMFYPSQLPSDVKPVDFGFWSYPVFKGWRIELGDEPKGTEVSDMPFTTIGFDGAVMDGKLWIGTGPDTAQSLLYEFDPATNKATKRFLMDGLFYGIHKLR